MVNRRSRIKEKAISPWHCYQDLSPRWVCSRGTTPNKQLRRTLKCELHGIINLLPGTWVFVKWQEHQNYPNGTEQWLIYSDILSPTETYARLFWGKAKHRISTYCVPLAWVRRGVLGSMWRVVFFLKHMGCINSIQSSVLLVWISRDLGEQDFWAAKNILWMVITHTLVYILLFSITPWFLCASPSLISKRTTLPPFLSFLFWPRVNVTYSIFHSCLWNTSNF